MSEKPKLIAVTGPTASGKSALAEFLSRELGGEIISCDSMQIYRRLDIGTAKPTKEEQKRTKYHLIDIIDISESFSVSDYSSAAMLAVDDIISRGKLPIICGGTGLYFESVIYPTDYPAAPCDIEYRTSLDGFSNSELYSRLLEIDPESAAVCHENNRKRVIRALEIYYLTGVKKSLWDKQSRTRKSRFDLIHITLGCSNRQCLYDRINARAEIMLKSGLLDEAKLIDENASSTARQAIGYKELDGYINGDETLNEASEKLKTATRNYAKRQLTWFSRYKDAKSFDISLMSGDEIAAEALKYIKNAL